MNSAKQKNITNAVATSGRLLSHYRFWGIAAVCFFVLTVLFLMVLLFLPGAPIQMLYVVMLCGFLWIGSTSFSRHALVVLKRHIGRKISMVEFLSTQFVAILFPIAYWKVKNEVRTFMEQQRVQTDDQA